MKLPNVDIRHFVYKACWIIAALAGLAGATGLIPLALAGSIGSACGVIGNALADKTVTAQKADGTLILTGTVQEQVAKGTDILIADAVKSVDVLSQAGAGFDKLNQIKNQSIEAINGIPVLGPIGAQILKDILK